ncbi:MAG: hypothetical protein GY796_22630 [Chloroflexi bacterium]|nr:hypothetical protein [Chloroflexota bacterium]
MSRKKKTHRQCVKVGCGESSLYDSLNSYGQVVHHYEACYQSDTTSELDFYKQPSLQETIELAALAKLPSGKRHPHQYRIPKNALHEAKRRLLSSDLQNCKSFDELLNKIDDNIRPIFMIGELAVYDTALRIGAYLDLEPDVIYLHRGVRDGAKAIGLDERQKYIEKDDLPSAFDILSPYEIEDCLCLYKDDLQKIFNQQSNI